MKKLLYLLAVAVATMTMFIACDRNDDPATSVHQDVISLVLGVDVFPEAGERPFQSEVISERTETSTEGGITTEWRCVTRRLSASQNPSEFVMFNPLAGVLWPGNLVQGASLASGIPASIPIPAELRQPGNISLAIVTEGGFTMYRTVDRMSFSQVNQAMNDILSEFTG